jgi:hypothetical protein
MTDLVERLRWVARYNNSSYGGAAGDQYNEAADAIVALQEQVRLLEEEMARRDENERRHCINHGPCSRMSAALKGA